MDCLQTIKDKNHTLPNPFYTWELFFPFALWHIWINRNHNIFHCTANPVNCSHIDQKVIEYTFFSNSTNSLTHPQITVLIKWYPPNSGNLKLNIDVSYSNTSNLGGIEGVFRDSNGRWIMGYHKKCMAINHTYMELMALYQGLNTAFDHQLRNLEIGTDSTEFTAAFAGLFSSLLAQLYNFVTLSSNEIYNVN